MERTTVSIIIPLYRAEHYLHVCMDQIDAQTYDHSAIECLLVCDGSPDNTTLQATRLIADNHSGITYRLLQHEQNLGVSAARNTGIKAATGQYLLFADVDDQLSPVCVATLIEGAQQYPNADMIVGNSLNQKTNGLFSTDQQPIYQQRNEGLLADVLTLVRGGFCWNRLIKHDFILRHQLFFPPDLHYFEDLYWNLMVARTAQAMVFLPQVTYYYEYVPTSAMQQLAHRTADAAHACHRLLELSLTFDEEPAAVLFCVHIWLQLHNYSHTQSDLNTLRRRVMSMAWQHHPLLLLYALQLYTPLRQFMRWRPLANRTALLRLYVYHNISHT